MARMTLTEGTRGRILVVDDDESCSAALQTLLASEGFDVDVAPGGEAALARIAERRPDVLLSDIRMPGMDGFSLLREAHARSDFRVILMSADGTNEAAVRSAGAVAYFVKPLDFDALIQALDDAVALPHAHG
jgi:DNA-binding NtrC family response regulator